MQHTEGMVVFSNAGHDKNRFYVLVKMDGRFGYIADGKRRKLKSPKRKNLAHLNPTATVLDVALDTDSILRRVLHSFNYPQGGADAVSVAD